MPGDVKEKRSTARGATLSRIIWRWHFWAGLIAGPVLIVLAVTGAIYIFKSDIEPLLSPELYHHESEAAVASLQQQLDSAESHAGQSWRVSVIEIDQQYPSTNAFLLTNRKHDHRRVRVGVRGAEYLGEDPENGLFKIVLGLHRRILAGTFGRVLTELTTSWTIVLLGTGMFLWWPKRVKRLIGAMVPRLKNPKRYVVARDSHAVFGVWLLPIAAVIALSGLLYSFVWGTSFLFTGLVSGSFDIEVNPPKSAVVEGIGNCVPVDRVWELALQKHLPLSRASIEIPATPDGAFSFKSGSDWGPSVSAILFIDQYSGEVIQEHSLGQLPLMAQWTQWNYPLHVGSVLGWTSKTFWLAACVVLASLPVTGVWMWLSRRKKGSSGVPKAYDASLPGWVLVLVIATGICLPTVGVSLVLVALLECSKSIFRSGTVALPDPEPT